MSKITLFHGTDHIIENPEYNIGNKHNDYGKGFYCTQSQDMAGEWACKQNADGFINCYDFDISGLKILNLTDVEHSILNWIALLLKYRSFSLNSPIAVDARSYIIEHFAIDTSACDVIIGYRADDSYFQYAESFVGNGLPLRSLNRALSLGRLGEQIVLVSEKAFEHIKFRDFIPAEKNVFYPKFLNRDLQARETYKKEIQGDRNYKEDIFVMDILREEIANDDPRIQRIVFK